MSIISGIDSGDLEEVKKSVKKNKKNMKLLSKRSGQTPLEYAIRSEEIEIVEYLLQSMKSARMKYKYDSSKTSNMMSVIPNVEIGKLLLKWGFDIESGYGSSVIANVILNNSFHGNYFPIVKFLIDNGAEINKDTGGWTPMMYACSHNDLELMEYFVSVGADIDVRDNLDRGILDIISSPKTIEKFLTFNPKIPIKTLNSLSKKHPKLLTNNKYILNYIDDLISINKLDIIPNEIKDTFLF